MGGPPEEQIGAFVTNDASRGIICEKGSIIIKRMGCLPMIWSSEVIAPLTTFNIFFHEVIEFRMRVKVDFRMFSDGVIQRRCSTAPDAAYDEGGQWHNDTIVLAADKFFAESVAI
jgi:hypothetical protein